MPSLHHRAGAPLALLVLLAPVRGAAAQACPLPRQPLFEFQVDEPAAFRGDSTRLPRPARDRFVRSGEHPDALIVQFVVDTAGVPDPRSLHVLRSPGAPAADSTRAALAGWRFTPATRGGCRVPQVVQTAITH